MEQAAIKDMQITFFSRTAESWAAMHADCMAATRSIDFEQYILMDDSAGGPFLRLFADKARGGVKVRLLLDSVGCRGLFLGGAMKALEEAGVEVVFFNSIFWRRVLLPVRWLPRNHIKTMLIDGRVAYTGSVCLWDLMRRWHDLHVRFTGPPVRDVSQDFSRAWAISAREEKGARVPIPPPDMKDEHPAFRYVVSEPRARPGRLYAELLDAVQGARRRIRIVTPYFLPPWRLYYRLAAAARRGVKVEVVMSARTDVPLADHVSHSYFPRFLRGGLSILLYPHEVLHAKYVLVDDDWATVGSTNIDTLSLLVNREANLVIRDEGLVRTLWDISDAYAAASDRVGPGFWRAVPLSQKMIGYLGRLARRIL